MGKRKKRIDWLNHFIAFAGVVIGVLLAFWLNSWYQSRIERRVVRTAVSNLMNEMMRNHSKIDSIIAINQAQAAFIDKYLEVVDEQMNLKISQSEIDQMVKDYPAYLNQDGRGISLAFDLYQLSNVAWLTAQSADVVPAIDFGLAYKLAEIYNTQAKLDDFDNHIIQDLKAIENSKESFKRIQLSVKTAAGFAIDLRDNLYPSGIRALESELRGR